MTFLYFLVAMVMTLEHAEIKCPNVPKLNAILHTESAWDDLGPCLLVDAGLVVMEDADRHGMPSLHDLAIATSLLCKTRKCQIEKDTTKSRKPKYFKTIVFK